MSNYIKSYKLLQSPLTARSDHSDNKSHPSCFSFSPAFFAQPLRGIAFGEWKTRCCYDVRTINSCWEKKESLLWCCFRRFQVAPQMVYTIYLKTFLWLDQHKQKKERNKLPAIILLVDRAEWVVVCALSQLQSWQKLLHKCLKPETRTRRRDDEVQIESRKAISPRYALARGGRNAQSRLYTTITACIVIDVHNYTKHHCCVKDTNCCWNTERAAAR